MAAEYSYLFAWLLGLAVILGAVIVVFAKMLSEDSVDYDERYIWLRKLPDDAYHRRK
ncbi:hypothetical protein PACILC2_00080 [Paenibacillus cisolokensis]|uniref:Uncharacterized protein n=1 Tax=Paenibacillus cisolokensis TaxID=1658519 RepID=A0ABQ4MZW2_9BACL|nr:hypothetical protein [Paenibacillus cisolokensis]GIQ61440.1 hypothetical protein PACILC2_00080 [Paenibacillus cisolokensis]